MPILLHQINYRNIQLTDAGECETVPVKLKNGDFRYIRWLGFISVEEAKESVGTPVKIKVTAYANDDFNPRWIVLEGKPIQGCLFESGVYGVLDGGAPRVILN